MTTMTDMGTLIVRSPDIRNNAPRIAGTGVTVKRVVGWYKLGLQPEDISYRIGHLTLARFFAALTYYHLHREEKGAEMEAENLGHEYYSTETDYSFYSTNLYRLFAYEIFNLSNSILFLFFASSISLE